MLLSKPKLVLMDESTSALDTANERLLYRALRDAGITYVSVGHRLAFVATSVIEQREELQSIEHVDHVAVDTGHRQYANAVTCMPLTLSRPWKPGFETVHTSRDCRIADADAECTRAGRASWITTSMSCGCFQPRADRRSDLRGRSRRRPLWIPQRLLDFQIVSHSVLSIIVTHPLDSAGNHCTAWSVQTA